MVEEKIFRCELCSATYKTADEAEACENNHKKYDEIIQVKYTPIGVDIDGKPKNIFVKFTDGSMQWYQRI